MWGLGVWSQACGSSFQLGLGSQPLLVLLQLGLHLCLVGWLANGSAAHPVVFPAADCGDGQVGVVSLGARENRSERWDAYCFRMQGSAAPQARSLLCLSLLTHSLAALPSLQTWPADAAMASWVMGPACAMGSCWMYWPPLPTSPPSMGYPGARGVVRRGSLWREPTHNPVSHHLQMLLGYANATPRGLEFLDFLDDEHTYKTLFVPVNEGFVDNMVTWSVGRAGPRSAFCGWSTTTAVLCPQTLSGPDLELHASNTTFLSTNASQGALLPAHSGLSLVISDLGPGNGSRAPEASLEVAPALLAQPSLIITGPDSGLLTGPRGSCGQPRHRVGHPGLQRHHPHAGQPPAGAPAVCELSVDRQSREGSGDHSGQVPDALVCSGQWWPRRPRLWQRAWGPWWLLEPSSAWWPEPSTSVPEAGPQALASLPSR